MNTTTLIDRIRTLHQQQRGIELDATQAKGILDTLVSISLADGKHGRVTESDINEYFNPTPNSTCES